MTEREQIEQSIAALEAQRAILGDAVVEPAIVALREKLAALDAPLASPPPGGIRGGGDQQRKQITVLFADVSGFTAMSETMDAEDVAEMMNALWTRLDAAIADHGGTIDKHIGDAVMALWSVEQAREDDPEYAVRAALDMQAVLAAFREERGVQLAMRIGLNTGPVLLGEMGTTGEYTAMGDTVNLASRLEHVAPVDGILISHDTYCQVRGIFDVQVPEPIQVRGKAEPVQVYAVQQAKPRAFRRGVRGVEGVETRMIGREAELKYLQDVFRTATDPVGSERQMVTIVGEAGVGKSRLLYEFENWVDLLSETAYYFKGRAGQEMQNLPYVLIRDLFAFRFQIQDSDRARVVREKMEHGIVEALGEEGGAQNMRAHFIGQLLGFDFSDSPHLQSILDDAKQIRDRALIYITDYFKAVAAQAPVLILLEDIHWADESSLDVLNRLALATSDRPLLILCTTRPTLFERRPHWGEVPSTGSGQVFHTKLELSPLSKRDSRRLVEEVLQKAEQVPEALRELVVSGAEGNPFYVEELIKMLIEDGVIVKGEEHWRVEPTRLTTVRVPATLTGVLQARLDGLPVEERTILQQASVVGRVFWDDIVERIGESASERVSESASERVGEREVPRALSALRDREMVFRRESSVFAGTQEYIFKHAILREVTYESVLKRLRRVYHALIARWLMEHGGERAGEVIGLIADHLELAGRTEEALVYLRRAGEQAAARFANTEAVNYLSRALDLTPKDNYAERYNLLLAREKIYDLQGAREVQIQDLAALERLAENLDDARPQADGSRRAEVALRRANHAELIGDYAAAIAVAQMAIDLAQAAQDAGNQAEGFLQWGRALWRQGDYEAARNRIERALAQAREEGVRQVEANSLRSLGLVFWHQSDYPQARAYFEQALHIFREVGDRQGEGSALNNLGLVSDNQGDYAEARTYYEQALHIYRETGDQGGEGIALTNLGYVSAGQGDYAGARSYYEQALRILSDTGVRRGKGATLCNLGLTFHHLGDDEAARRHSQQALQIAQDIGDRRHQGYALTCLGHALAGLGQLAEAAGAYRNALDIRREIGEFNQAMESLAGLAYISLAQEDPPQAQAQVEEILSHLETNTPSSGSGHGLDGTEEPFWIYLTCYHALRANQDPRAGDMLTTTYTLLQEQAAKITDEQVRRSFLENVAAHQEIVSEWQAVRGE